MKWLCLVVLLLDLILVAYSGFRYMTVNENHVKDLRAAAEDRIAEAQSNVDASDARINDLIRLSGEGALGDDYNTGYETEAETSGSAQDSVQGGYVGRAAESEFIVDQSSAMQLNSFPGVTNARNKLRDIEGTRNESNTSAKKAFDELE